MGLSEAKILGLVEAVASVPARGAVGEAIERWRAAANALRFHLRRRDGAKRMVVVLGGTGTGKSTIVNRLLGADVTAASFRRTFTAGAVAVAAQRADVAEGWLDVPHAVAESQPARGEADRLIVVEHVSEVTERLVLVDTPDLDGDQPAHHAQADRAFRWAEGIVFLVTPEKYQMTELIPYYRLARRYAVPAVFVMNKVEEAEAARDYAEQLAGHGFAGASVFAVGRDDSPFQAEEGRNLGALSETLKNLPGVEAAQHQVGLKNRAADLLDRLHDQVLGPIENDRREADRLVENLRAMEAPQPGVDVNPLTKQLARRLQQRSILYLMGPQRVLDRVRQVPSLLVRLPKTAFDWVRTGKVDLGALGDDGRDQREVPDFRVSLVD
ncbi:MAG TPA: GTPase domain-containing protein, partial [Tepidisphaeraceae bacterium]